MLKLTGVPHSEEIAPPSGPTVGVCLGPYGGPRGVAISYERGIHVMASMREGGVVVPNRLYEGVRHYCRSVRS